MLREVKLAEGKILRNFTLEEWKFHWENFRFGGNETLEGTKFHFGRTKVWEKVLEKLCVSILR